MKFKSALVTQASGSVGGLTASHNRGGQYFRARSIPTNPGSTFQSLVRGYMNSLSNAWVNVLGASVRTAWATYADNVPLVDTLGESRHVTGLNMFVRSNLPRLQAGLDSIGDAPVDFSLAALTNPGIASITASTGIASITFEPSDAWADSADGALLVAASRPQNASITYFKGPYRFAGAILGNATPITSPKPITLPFTVAAGQRVFLLFRATNSDARLSSPFRLFGTAV